MVMIEFCQANVAQWTKQVREQIMNDPEWADVEVMEYGCLGNCGQCYLQPFVMVDGEIVAAETPEQLLINIKEHIRKKLEEDKQWREMGF